MPAVRITIPAEHAERFKEEATATLDYASTALNDTVRFFRRGGADGVEIPYYRARVEHAERLFDQVRDQGGTLLVDGDPRVISTTLEGCLLDAVDEVKGAAEMRRGRETRAAVRRTMADVELWLHLLEHVEETAGGVDAVYA
ncbi:MAG TPA: hypothetical protein VD790_11390 [Thermoleophilaceae bacterium]|nr:hypothetical protein [Thermoleophilaceae bacterium]